MHTLSASHNIYTNLLQILGNGNADFSESLCELYFAPHLPGLPHAKLHLPHVSFVGMVSVVVKLPQNKKSRRIFLQLSGVCFLLLHLVLAIQSAAATNHKNNRSQPHLKRLFLLYTLGYILSKTFRCAPSRSYTCETAACLTFRLWKSSAVSPALRFVCASYGI